MGDNLKTFNRLIKEGATESEAAIGTFTGTAAKRLKFGNAKVENKVLGENGEYISVDVTFSKTQ